MRFSPFLGVDFFASEVLSLVEGSFRIYRSLHRIIKVSIEE